MLIHLINGTSPGDALDDAHDAPSDRLLSVGSLIVHMQLAECPSTVRIGTQNAARGHVERVGSGTLDAAAAVAGRTFRHR
jgi:hypothetical protein